MKIALDLQAIQSESAMRGVGRYSAGLADAMIAARRFEPTVVLNTALDSHYERAIRWVRQRVSGDQIRSFHGPKGIMGLTGSGRSRWDLSGSLYDAFLAQCGIDVIHTSAPFDGMGDDSVVGNPRSDLDGRLCRVATLYDLIPFEEPDHYLADPRYSEWFRYRLETLGKYDLLLTISDYTRRVAIDFGVLPASRIVAISTDTTGIFQSQRFDDQQSRVLLSRYGISKPFVMHTGILEARKNVETLIAAFAMLPGSLVESFCLVLAADATDAQRARVRFQTAQLGLPKDSVVFAGYVPDADLVGLYNHARCVVMPSLSEGFGLPLLEAMRCGAAVLGARATSIPEVIGSEDYLFNPRSPADLASKLALMLSDEPFHAAAVRHSERQNKAFRWSEIAGRAINAIEDIAGHKRRTRSDTAVRFYGLPTLVDPDTVHAAGLIDVDPAAGPTRAQGWPILIVGEAGLDERQEEVIRKGAFGLLSLNSNGKIPCSRDLLFHALGLAGLLAAPTTECVAVSLQGIENLPTCMGAEQVSVTGEVAEALGDLTAKLRCRLAGFQDFLSRIPGGIQREDAMFIAEAAVRALDVRDNANRRRPVLFIDISEIVKVDAKTGIQRVVRSIITVFFSAFRSFKLELIYRDGDRYRLARRFGAGFFGVEGIDITESYVNFYDGDIFVGLDLDALISPGAMRHLRQARLAGVRLVWIVYDILPELRPEWFDAPLAEAVQRWLRAVTGEADQIICISKAVADDLRAYVEHSAPTREHDLRISWWHLGSDLENSAPTEGVSPDDEARIAAIPLHHPTFITVGTIEPRKGIGRLLDGMDAFWAQGEDAVLILVGRPGWNVDALLKRLRTHPRREKQLFWFDHASDELLNRLYQSSSAALLPSEGEGFGLPLVEAARHGLPVVARDIPVFREVGGDGAFYFRNGGVDDFAEDLVRWIRMSNAGTAPPPPHALLTWQQSGDRLYQIIEDNEAYVCIEVSPLPVSGA